MARQNKKEKRISPSMIAIIGAVLTLIGGFFISYNYIQKKKILAYDYMANIFYKENSENEISDNKIEYQEESNKEASEELEQNEIVNNTNYIGYLEIPKINLNKGFFDIKSPDNDVEKNIYIVEGSSYPDVEKGNFIIAAHSGNGWKAFFNDLYKLSNGDNAIVKYNGKTYTYKITNIYNQEKTGTIAIYRNYNKTTLTLVTCTNNNNKSQTVYIAELVSVSNE